ncbi:MAG: GNAT family N-acetyltransferase [Bacteroidota bacterium]
MVASGYELIRVKAEDTRPLQAFLARAGTAKENFRYFASRPLEVIAQHKATFLLGKGDEIAAYGHLDEEEGVIWLGIAVAEPDQGKGLGRQMMDHLLSEASRLQLPKIRLSVDLDNHRAVKLYQSLGFEIAEERKTFYFMEKMLPQELQVAVSTVAFAHKKLDEAIGMAESAGLFLEFSSGMPYQPDLIERYLAYPHAAMPHNYFPPPEEPFVLNLASAIPEIRQQSVDHCLQGLELCRAKGAPFFAAHAGFCLDPDPSQLGQKITAEMRNSKEKHWGWFMESVKTVLEKAQALDMPFLIENNVIIAPNLLEDGTNPLLGCEQGELNRLITEQDHPLLGILLDTAHLKVSAQTLGLQLDAEMQALLPIVSALHHSDNDGTVDNNQPLPRDYWFLPYVKEFADKVHVIEVKNIELDRIVEQTELLQQALKNAHVL